MYKAKTVQTTLVKGSDSSQILWRQVSPLSHFAAIHQRSDGGQAIFREVMSI